MFDIGFPELMLVSVVALIFIGPERLPDTVRTLMLWVGRIRRSFTSIKTELEQEIGVDEIRQQLHNESIMKDIRETRETIESAMQDADQSMNELKQSMDPRTIVTAEPQTTETSPDQNIPSDRTESH